MHAQSILASVAELRKKLCANSLERFNTILVYNDVRDVTLELQGQGQSRSTMVIIQKNEDEEASDTSSMKHFL